MRLLVPLDLIIANRMYCAKSNISLHSQQ